MNAGYYILHKKPYPIFPKSKHFLFADCLNDASSNASNLFSKVSWCINYNSYNHMLMVAKFVAKNKKQLIICYTHTLFYLYTS